MPRERRLIYALINIEDIFTIQDEITLGRYTTTSNVEAWTYWVQACPSSARLPIKN
jgi:hypothetical protein